MEKLLCPLCNKVSQFEDTGVGWKCPDCSGKVYTKYVDTQGIEHRYADTDNDRKMLDDQAHIFDVDAMDIMTGRSDQSPFYSLTFEAKSVQHKLLSLADHLDKIGYTEEANKIDEFIKKETENKTYFKDVKDFPYGLIYNLTTEPLPTL